MSKASATKLAVAVIGAGMGGMTTAARLAKAGHQVTVYEASDRHGGKCRTEWIGNYAFDTGPSLLTLPAVYRDFFQRTGEVMGRVLELIPVSPSFDYRFSDGKSFLAKKLSLQSLNPLAPRLATSGIASCAPLRRCGMFRVSLLLNLNYVLSLPF